MILDVNKSAFILQVNNFGIKPTYSQLALIIKSSIHTNNIVPKHFNRLSMPKNLPNLVVSLSIMKTDNISDTFWKQDVILNKI